MARAQARKPDWLQLSSPPTKLQDAAGGHPAPDTTARVLEFPATALRRPTTAADSRQLPPPPGSLLAAEPAYRSALSRLGGGSRPGTAPGMVGSSLPSAALPSSRLDALLASRPGTAAAAGAATTAAPVSSSRLDALLSSRPVVGKAAARQSAPGAALLPSSRLEELLPSRPRPASSSSKSALPSSRLDELLASRPPVRPATAASAPAGPSASDPAAGGRGMQPRAPAPPVPAGGARPAAHAALSPVKEEPGSASRAMQSLQAGAHSRPALSQSLAAAGAGAHPEPAAPAAAGVVRPAAGGMLDPALQDRLRERIEIAKAQIRQQLSPMFRLSEALLGAEQDPQRAADALDAATGVSANGFELLARRPGSRGGSAGAGGGGGGGTAAGAKRQQQGFELGEAGGRPGSAAAKEGRQPREGVEAMQHHSTALAARGSTAAASAILGSTEEVDSLVANARAAAARAQSALAELASPPRTQQQQHQHRQHATPERRQHPAAEAAAVPATTRCAAAGSAPRPAAPLPCAQLIAPAGGSMTAMHAHRQQEQQLRELVPGQLLPLGRVDARAWVEQLRQRSEDLIRSECERLVESMHLLFDGMLDGLQQEMVWQQHHHQQRQQLQQGREPTPGAAAGASGSSMLPAKATYAGLQRGLDAEGSRQDDGGSTRSAAVPSGSLNSSSGGSEAEGGSWQSAEEQEQQLEQQGREQGTEEEQAPLCGENDGSDGSDCASAAFQFAPQGRQPEGHQVLQPGSQTADESPPEHQQRQQHQHQHQQPVGAGFAGFGSPIRVLPSPAKPAGGAAPSRLRFAATESSSGPAAERAGSQPAGSRYRQEQEQELQDEQEQPWPHARNTAAQSLSLGRPGHAAAKDEQVTPALGASCWAGCMDNVPPPTGLDPYLTARSVAAPASCDSSAVSDAFDSPHSPAAGSEGASSSGGGTSGGGGLFGGSAALGHGSPGRGAAARRPMVHDASATPLLGAGGKDLDSIVGSIRRLAAEMRLKQGLLAMPPAGSLGVREAGSLQGGGPNPLVHDTPSAASKPLFTPAGSSKGASGSLHTGALYTAASSGPGSSSAAALRKSPR